MRSRDGLPRGARTGFTQCFWATTRTGRAYCDGSHGVGHVFCGLAWDRLFHFGCDFYGLIPTSRSKCSNLGSFWEKGGLSRNFLTNLLCVGWP